MDCKTAQALWNHKGGLIGGLNCKGHGYDGVMPYLMEQARKFVNGLHDPFNEAVKKKVGYVGIGFFVTHNDGKSDLAKKVHEVLGDEAARRIVSQTIGTIFQMPKMDFSNICCNGCKISEGSVEHNTIIRIQMAAVNTAPDGSDITR